LTKDQDDTKTVFSKLVQTLKEASNQVVGFEKSFKFIVVLVIAPPKRPALLVKVLPEPFASNPASVLLIRVDSFPVVKIEVSGR
jgi:hypothetical protein